MLLARASVSSTYVITTCYGGTTIYIKIKIIANSAPNSTNWTTIYFLSTPIIQKTLTITVITTSFSVSGVIFSTKLVSYTGFDGISTTSTIYYVSHLDTTITTMSKFTDWLIYVQLNFNSQFITSLGADNLLINTTLYNFNVSYQCSCVLSNLE